MQWLIFDFEVFEYDWILVAKYFNEDHIIKLHNDEQSLKELLADENLIWIGFNSKGYDQFIAKAINAGFDNAAVKHVNDLIISGVSGYNIQIPYCKMNISDLMDDMQIGTSLKSIEGHLGLNIQESEVDFNIKRPLTYDELNQSIQYCTADVLTTERLANIRLPYLQTKIRLGAVCGLSEAESLSMTNAKLTSKYLGAIKNPMLIADEREYKFPDNLKTEYIPDDVIKFYQNYSDERIKLSDILQQSYEFTLKDCEIKVTWGGIHGVVRNTVFVADDNKVLRNADVKSYYPMMILLYGYQSRAMQNPERYKQAIDMKFNAKDKQTANDYKLIINTANGATLNPNNDLYDPLQARSVSITGQLFLLELCCHCIQAAKTFTPIQLNTDGLAYEVDKSELQIVDDILTEWQNRTGFTLEIDDISKFIQRDVNNYLMIKTDGSVKSKGGEFKKGVNTIGAFSINNNNIIISEAIKNYFINGISVEDTVNSNTDIFNFQMISKASSKYSSCYTYQNDKQIQLQKVNRVYASTNQHYGTLYKVSKADNRVAKIANLPEHCIIDNDNQLSVNDIDKQWYINKAKSKIANFIKERSLFKMAESKTKVQTPLNIYQKLIKIRLGLLENGVEKSGKNRGVGYKYFELADIIPLATPLFDQYGVFPMFNMDNENASLTVINTDNPDEKVVFTLPIAKAPVNRGITEIQAIGSTQTYFRRYLYLSALDIVEADTVDNDLPTAPTVMQPTAQTITPQPIQPQPIQPKPIQPISVTPVQPAPIAPQQQNRAEAKAVLTQQANIGIDDATKQTLIDACNNYLQAMKGDEQAKALVDSVYQQTNNLTDLTKSQAEIIIAQIQDQIGKVTFEQIDDPTLTF